MCRIKKNYINNPKLKIKLGINKIKATATGKTYNQQTSINWSYRNLGNVALNHTKKKQNKQVFIPKTKAGIFKYKSFKDKT